MNPALDETHDPGLRSWVKSAAGSDFPIQNLPLGIFRDPAGARAPRIGAAIGDCILDLAECAQRGLLSGLANQVNEACRRDSLNELMGLGAEHRSELRLQISRLLRAGPAGAYGDRNQAEAAIVPMGGTCMVVPARIGDYTDFYASIHHAENVGRMFRPENPLLPNYKYVPIGYHGRASSIVVSGTPVRRPCGQTEKAGSAPEFGRSRMLDYELEVGAFVGPGNALGETIRIDDAESQLFGLCLVNDWSARDIQKWEYQPLGPFLAKSFATTISPWVVTLEALAPFRAPAFIRPPGDPAPLPYLLSTANQERGGFDITLEVHIWTQHMREQGIPPSLLSRGSFKELYWTLAQLVTHHASNGCNLRPGDLLASGTVSGPDKRSLGCLLELTRRGVEPIELPTGDIRRFLEDGDVVVLRARAERRGFATIGFGECRGTIVGT